MKIAIIGASGKLGQIIVNKLLKKGDTNLALTALVRNKDKISQDIRIVETDIFNITSKEVEKYDIVINAYGPGKNEESLLVDATKHLISIFDKNTTTRLIICGGVGPLFTDSNKNMRVSESPLVPDFVVKLATAETTAFYFLEKNNSFNWIYFAPPLELSYENKNELGSYNKAGEIMVTPNNGNINLSYQDYALAIIDEVYNKNYSCNKIISITGNE